MTGGFPVFYPRSRSLLSQLCYLLSIHLHRYLVCVTRWSHSRLSILIYPSSWCFCGTYILSLCYSWQLELEHVTIAQTSILKLCHDRECLPNVQMPFYESPRSPSTSASPTAVQNVPRTPFPHLHRTHPSWQRHSSNEQTNTPGRQRRMAQLNISLPSSHLLTASDWYQQVQSLNREPSPLPTTNRSQSIIKWMSK